LIDIVFITSTVDHHVAFVLLDRPAKRNAVSGAMKLALAETWASLASDPEVHAIVLSGAGGTFSAGSDLGEIANGGPVTTDVLIGALPGVGVQLDTPVVAALEGWTLGFGLSLAIHADLRVAAEGVRLGFPEVEHGSISAVSARVLGELIARGPALDLLLTGDPIDARRAHAIGLVDRVVATGEALAAATALARTIAGRDPAAVRATKRLAVAGSRARTLEALPAIDAERAALHPELAPS
jgi:enoyl-CoA hydratase/carnithine racemase